MVWSSIHPTVQIKYTNAENWPHWSDKRIQSKWCVHLFAKERKTLKTAVPSTGHSVILLWGSQVICFLFPFLESEWVCWKRRPWCVVPKVPSGSQYLPVLAIDGPSPCFSLRIPLSQPKRAIPKWYITTTYRGGSIHSYHEQQKAERLIRNNLKGHPKHIDPCRTSWITCLTTADFSLCPSWVLILSPLTVVQDSACQEPSRHKSSSQSLFLVNLIKGPSSNFSISLSELKMCVTWVGWQGIGIHNQKGQLFLPDNSL